jgi:hypothetical protein
MSNPFAVNDLVATRNVLGQRHDGSEVVKARLGKVEDVGKKGALVRFDDDVKHPTWCPQGVLWFQKVGDDGHVELVKKRPQVSQPYVELPEKFPSSPPEDDEEMKNDQPPRMPIMPRQTTMSVALSKAAVPVAETAPAPSPESAPAEAPGGTPTAQSKIAMMIAAGMDPWKIWEEMGRDLIAHEEKAITDAKTALAAAESNHREAQRLVAEAERDVTEAQKKLNSLLQRQADARRRLAP